VELNSCRLDVWLFRTRLTKTRGEAQTLIKKGKVRLTRGTETSRVTKSHFQLRPGDRIAFMRHKQLFQVEMLDPGQRRGPAPEARALYRDLSDSSAS
jgi:ribosome-associated heat shock protein Hsp15